MLVTCSECGYSWERTGKSYYAQCPRCRHNNPPKEQKKPKKK